MLKWFFNFSTNFRFSKISVECSVHICSCPWLLGDGKNYWLPQKCKLMPQSLVLSRGQFEAFRGLILRKIMNFSKVWIGILADKFFYRKSKFKFKDFLSTSFGYAIPWTTLLLIYICCAWPDNIDLKKNTTNWYSSFQSCCTYILWNFQPKTTKYVFSTLF